MIHLNAYDNFLYIYWEQGSRHGLWPQARMVDGYRWMEVKSDNLETVDLVNGMGELMVPMVLEIQHSIERP